MLITDTLIVGVYIDENTPHLCACRIGLTWVLTERVISSVSKVVIENGSPFTTFQMDGFQ